MARELELHYFLLLRRMPVSFKSLAERIRMQIPKTDVPEKSNRFLASSSIPFFVFLLLPFLFLPFTLESWHTQIKRFFFVLMKRGKWRFGIFFLFYDFFLCLPLFIALQIFILLSVVIKRYNAVSSFLQE